MIACKSVLALRFAVVFVLFSILTSCNKEDVVLESPPDSDPIMERYYVTASEADDPHPFYFQIFKDLTDYHEETAFASTFEENYGFPLWEHTIFLDSIPDTLISVTPLVDTVNQSVEGILYANRINGANYYEIIQKDYVHSNIEQTESEAELRKLYNALLHIHLFSKMLYCTFDPKYVENEQLLNTSLGIEVREIVYVPVYVWEPWCPGDGTGVGGGWHTAPGLGVGRWKFVGYTAVYIHSAGQPGRNWGLNTNWGDGSWGGGSSGGGDGPSGPIENIFVTLEKVVQRILLEEGQSFIDQHGLELTVPEFINIIGMDCMTLEAYNGVPTGVFLDEECALEAVCEYNKSTFSDTYGVSMSEINELVGDCPCLNDVELRECLIRALAAEMVECDQYDFIGCNDLVNAPNGICPESFKFQSVGQNSYSCSVAGVAFKYRGAITKTMYIGDLCIQVPNRNSDGEFVVPYEAAELMSEAWNEAQALTAAAYAASNHTMTEAAYKSAFVANLRITMILYFSGTFGQGTMSVSTQICGGSVPIGKPSYSIFC